MANVAFRKGTQAALDQLTPVNGTFYFTTDSKKLYLADNDALVDLTHFCNFVTTQSELPSTAKTGSLYYVTGENIFCIRNNSSTSPYYTQINPNTVLTATTSAVTLSDITDGVSVATSISDSSNNVASGSFSIIEGNGNVHISRSGSTISISADNNADDHISSLSTQLNSSNGTVRLTEKLNGTETGHDDITFTGSGWASVSSGAAGTGTGGNTVTINVPELEISNGLSFNSSGVLTASSSLATTGGNASVTPTVAYGKPATTGGTRPASATFNSGTANLDVYTTSQIDTLLTSLESSLNAMAYKGTVNATTGPTLVNGTAGKVGDTYKVAAAFTAGGENYKVGDLIIAKGVDDNVTWEIVPSGDDQLIGGAVATNYFQVNDSLTTTESLLKVNLAESSDTTKAKINVTGTVVSAGTNGVGSEVTYTFSHGAPGTGSAETFTSTATNPTVDSNYVVTNVASTLDVYSISGISLDSVGHVTDITTSKYVISDTHNHIASVNVNVGAVSNNSATTQIQVSGTDGDGATASLIFKSSSTAPTTDGGIQISRPSGVTNTVQIDMVWGSF